MPGVIQSSSSLRVRLKALNMRLLYAMILSYESTLGFDRGPEVGDSACGDFGNGS